MISASLSLSLPRLGWKSTSTPRSLKICTAAGESASEMRTRGVGMMCSDLFRLPASSAAEAVGWVERSETHRSCEVMAGYAASRLTHPTDRLRGHDASNLENDAHAALGSASLVLPKAQSSHAVSASTSLASTVAPHQMRRPGGAS